MDRFIGLWNIFQQNNIDDKDMSEYLTELDTHAARMPLNIGGRFVWEITKPDNSPFYTLTLIPNGMPDPTPPPVLTLGQGVAGMEEMTVMVEPQVPGSMRQMWKLTEQPSPFPDMMMASIMPAEVPELSAAVAKQMPNPMQYVYAVPKQWPEENRVWMFKRPGGNQ